MRPLVVRTLLSALILSSSIGLAAAQDAQWEPRHMRGTEMHHGWDMQRPPHGRLQRIDREISRLERRVSMERQAGRLSPREARMIHRRAERIAAAAALMAHRHEGRIPPWRLARLQREIRHLDRLVMRLSMDGRMSG